jgi:hypothetical protein
MRFSSMMTGQADFATLLEALGARIWMPGIED